MFAAAFHCFLTPVSRLPDLTSCVLLSSYGQEPPGTQFEELWEEDKQLSVVTLKK